MSFEDFFKSYLFNHKTTRVAGSQPTTPKAHNWLTDERSAENAASSIRKHSTSHIIPANCKAYRQKVLTPSKYEWMNTLLSAGI